ncbi:replication initiation protein [Vibrio sp. T20]|uniref:replication initiation protein n=1 Tax=Vibrio sp. T20 TaxID=2588450 RepID=UPI0011B4F2C3|nr:replication initiation protein [Vibrio sp. T20]
MNKDKPQAANLKTYSNNNTEEHVFDLGSVPSPCPSGGKIVKLKHELIYAEHTMSLIETRLLYYCMSHFNVSEHFNKDDGTLPSDEECNLDFKPSSKEIRSISFPMSVLLKDICHDSKSNSYDPLKSAMQSLIGKTFRLFHKGGKTEVITPIENAFIYKCEKTKLYHLLVTFGWDFMRFVIGTRGYCKLNLKDVFQFKSPLAIRYYHWLINSININKAFGRIPVTIDTLKSRLAIPEGAYQKHFYSRCVLKPLEEVAKRADLDIKVEQFFNKQVRGRPLQRIVITSKLSSFPYGGGLVS